MAGFHGQQGFHRRHAHRQWVPRRLLPTTAASLPGWSYGPPQPMPPAPSPRLGTEIVTLLLRTQIEYYFSEDNLARNVHLKMQMDEEGWVSVHTIASFPRVKRLTNDVVLILRSLQPSPTVEVEPHYFSPHEPSLGYRTWILPTSSGKVIGRTNAKAIFSGAK
ncbi:unnamed protein product [Spirodela intermedia]|uniref:HTH La-type RNA-binding domain-containing protein n=1 Tax=Spirodela intermedia TaxID=51605 RepID=A0ABN7E8N3_SPIIN|nr:unnamed protein product [Spirodela intermedia]